MNTSKIEMRDPADLTPLAVVKKMVRWAPDSDEFVEFKEDIRDHGIKHPIQITAGNKVVDGWTRVLAARAWQFKEVPVVVVSEQEVLQTVVREMNLRRNLTKGQRAYTVSPWLDELRAEKGLNSKKNLQKGQCFSEAPLSGKSKSWSELVGFGAELLRQADRLHAIFDDAKNKDIAGEWEAKILALDKPIGLGAALAGIEQVLLARENPGMHRPDKHNQLELFSEMLVSNSHNHLKYWQATHEQALKLVKEKAASLKTEQCAALAEMYAEMAKVYAKAAKA